MPVPGDLHDGSCLVFRWKIGCRVSMRVEHNFDFQEGALHTMSSASERSFSNESTSSGALYRDFAALIVDLVAPITVIMDIDIDRGLPHG